MATLCLLLLPFAALANDSFEVTEGLPELPEWLPPLLESNGYSAENADGVKLTFWFCKELPSKEPGGEFNVEYPTLPQGGIVGIVQIHAPWSDYRKRIVEPGLFTMRYGIQPPDGDHTGVTYFRDFLILTPVAVDTFGTQTMETKEELEPLIEAAKASTGTEHPGVMGLYQIYDEVPETQVMENDWGETTLAARRGDLILGISLEGHGQDLQL